jgi:superfamily II DNA or RNA helicase
VLPQVTIAANAVVAKIFNADDAVKNLMTEKLSYLVEGHEHMQAFAFGSWNGRSSFFARRTCSFPAGFVHLVHSELVAAGYQVSVVKKPCPAPLGPEDPVVDKFAPDPRYDFQPKALRQVEKHRRGIVQVATGGGKSRVAKLIIARYRRMSLFITTRGVLLYQMKDQLERDCGFNVGVIGDGEFSPTKGANVGMVQTFVAQLKEPNLATEKLEIMRQVGDKGLRWGDKRIAAAGQQRFDEKTKTRARLIKLLSLVEVVIGEEAHEAGGNSYYEILKYCTNAHIRVALTATPFMRSASEDNMRLMGAFGPKLIQVSEKLLIDRGILAKPYFKFVNSQPHPKLRKSSPWQRAYQFGYTENPYLLSDVVRDASRAASCGLPVMTLIQRKAHGSIVKKAMQDAGLRVRYIQGENDQRERKSALDALEGGKIDVLIGTTILDVGVDVPAVGLVQLAGGGKAEVALRQRIGRGMRSKKNGPNYCFVADYSVEINSHLRDHARQRRAIIEGTSGFREGILAAGKDFPWELFERKAV